VRCANRRSRLDAAVDLQRQLKAQEEFSAWTDSVERNSSTTQRRRLRSGAVQS
jgi:hypothetical protein